MNEEFYLSPIFCPHSAFWIRSKFPNQAYSKAPYNVVTKLMSEPQLPTHSTASLLLVIL